MPRAGRAARAVNRKNGNQPIDLANTPALEARVERASAAREVNRAYCVAV
jgi:hypothetical protein